jgi:hypothetical protein
VERPIIGPDLYDADRVVELARHQIGDNSFEVCPLDLGFAVNGAQSAKVVDYKINGLISAVGHDPWRPTGAGWPTCSTSMLEAI